MLKGVKKKDFLEIAYWIYSWLLASLIDAVWMEQGLSSSLVLRKQLEGFPCKLRLYLVCLCANPAVNFIVLIISIINPLMLSGF